MVEVQLVVIKFGQPEVRGENAKVSSLQELGPPFKPWGSNVVIHIVPTPHSPFVPGSVSGGHGYMRYVQLQSFAWGANSVY